MNANADPAAVAAAAAAAADPPVPSSRVMVNDEHEDSCMMILEAVETQLLCNQ